MPSNISEFPKHPLPHVPPAQDPQHLHAQPPTVFVYEKQRWEYRTISTSTEPDAHLIEEELNALGKDGWELVGVVPLPGAVQLYQKRARG